MADGSDQSSLVDRLPLKPGAVLGVGAFVSGLALTFVLLWVDSGIDFDEIASEGPIGVTDYAGWVFYNAQFVDIESTYGPGGGSESGSVFDVAPFALPELLYYLVPAAAIAAAGYVLVTRLDARDALGEATPKEAGAAIVAGYLPAAVAGAFLFEITYETPIEAGGTTTQGPELMSAILLAGVLYPIVFGAAGGVLATRE